MTNYNEVDKELEYKISEAEKLVDASGKLVEDAEVLSADMQKEIDLLNTARLKARKALKSIDDDVAEENLVRV